MGKNLPHEQRSVQLFAKNVTQITLYHASFADLDKDPVNPVVRQRYVANRQMANDICKVTHV
jgi:hypothetical protein